MCAVWVRFGVFAIAFHGVTIIGAVSFLLLARLVLVLVLALQIRNIITQGMDDIWRERNTAQHHPNAREEINAKIQEAYEKKELLGLDQGPHREPSDITSLPFKMKQKWLENANQRIEKKEEENARRAAAVKALQTGSKWAWNPATNTKTKRAGRRKETASIMVPPWKAMATTPNQTPKPTLHTNNYNRNNRRKEVTLYHRQ